MTPATTPDRTPGGRKLLVIDERGYVSHHTGADFPSFVRRGDLIVANDAATLPASLSGLHARTGRPIEIRLAGRGSLSPSDVSVFVAVVFGEGDHRTPTEHRPLPPELRRGDQFLLGPLRATVVALRNHPRLVEVRFEHGVQDIWEGLARHGRPIQYSYVPQPLALWDTWTSIAAAPAAFEAPAAGFALDWGMVAATRARGARFATLTHAAGISSTGDDTLDAQLPFDEPYFIPASTAELIARTRQRDGRVIAIGTTVVRALEHAASETGSVMPGAGLATGRIGVHTTLRIVEAILSGVHEPATSHYELLRAFQQEATLERMAAEAEEHGYRSHEFGDAVLIVRDVRGTAQNVTRAA
jgi:S-adenosylmethionine:tRNA ribosyltransferase-isomerase